MIKRFDPNRTERSSTWNWLGGVLVVLLLLGAVAIMMRGTNTNVAESERGVSPVTTTGSGVTAPATTGAGSTAPRR